MINRSSLLAGRSCLNSSQSIKPLYQVTNSSLTTSAVNLASQESSPPPKDKKNLDDVNYEVRVKKELTYKELFKDAYSLYGPIFIGTHISISLISLGFWYSLVWITVDPTQYISEKWLNAISENVITMTGEGGKFVLAYAFHKLTLPVRLAGSIMLTRKLSYIIKSKRKDVDT